MKKTLCTLLLFLCSGCSAVKVSTNINDVMIANQIAKHDLYKFRNHQHANEMGATMKALGDIAVRTTRGKAEEEYSALFYGKGSGGEIHPYASYYLTGFVYEKPLADLRRDLTEIGVKRTDVSEEPEDHIAFLCEIMHGLIVGTFDTPSSLAHQRDFFNRHLATWAVKVFEDLEGAESAALYMPVGKLGKLFMAVEAEAFGMVAA